MIIRTLKEEDIKAVIILAEESEGLTAERPSIYWFLWKFFRNTCFVAEENGDIVGILLGFMDQVENKTGFIHELGVSKKFRSKGIASALIEKFERAIKQLGGNKICLTTLANNTNAVRFYENRNFNEKTEILKVGEKRIQFCKKIA